MKVHSDPLIRLILAPHRGMRDVATVDLEMAAQVGASVAAAEAVGAKHRIALGE